MNLYHVTKFSPYFSFTVYCFYTKIGKFIPVLSKRIVLDCFYLLIFYFEKFSTDVCRLPCAVNVNLNLSNNTKYPVPIYISINTSGRFFKTNLTKCAVICVKKRQKGRFRKTEKLQNHSHEGKGSKGEKERARRWKGEEKKAMVAL